MSEEADLLPESNVVAPSPFQQRVLALPEHWNLLLAGGRGGSKSVCSQFLMIRHAMKYRERAKILYVRESWESIKQFEDELAQLIQKVFGKEVGHHSTNHMFTWHHGATIQLSQLEDEKDYSKFQGKNYSMLVVDEYGARRDTKYVWLLASNMRAPRGIPTQIILLANPGGQQHGHLHYDFIAQGPAWQPFDKAGEPWIHAPSTWRDNPHIDQAAYVRKLRQACGNDEELFKAWDSGDWNIARGAYFAGALDEKVHMLSIPQEESDPRIIAPECPYPLTREWQPFIAQDWGSGAPCITTVFGESPGVPGFPKGSLIAVDELALHEVNDLNVGLNWSPDKLAEGVKDLCKPWRVFPSGVGDDAYGLEDTLLNTLRKLGIYLRRPKKERVAGWQLMRNMLVSVKNRDGGPGLWISARCQYFWRTVPFLSRDPKRPEDILTKNVPDHSGDCIRYGIQSRGHRVTSGSVTGI